MRIMIVIFSIVIFNYSSYAQSSNIELDSITIEKFDESGNHFSFSFSLTDFDSTGHDLSQLREGLIDGNQYWGTDGEIPSTQIKDFILKINDQKIEIDESIYSSFYNPNCLRLWAYWGLNFESVFIFMDGSDGAGSYSVVWSISINGQHSRSVIGDELYFKSLSN